MKSSGARARNAALHRPQRPGEPAPGAAVSGAVVSDPAVSGAAVSGAVSATIATALVVPRPARADTEATPQLARPDLGALAGAALVGALVLAWAVRRPSRASAGSASLLGAVFCVSGGLALFTVPAVGVGAVAAGLGLIGAGARAWRLGPVAAGHSLQGRLRPLVVAATLTAVAVWAVALTLTATPTGPFRPGEPFVRPWKAYATEERSFPLRPTAYPEADRPSERELRAAGVPATVAPELGGGVAYRNVSGAWLAWWTLDRGRRWVLARFDEDPRRGEPLPPVRGLVSLDAPPAPVRAGRYAVRGAATSFDGGLFVALASPHAARLVRLTPSLDVEVERLAPRAAASVARNAVMTLASAPDGSGLVLLRQRAMDPPGPAARPFHAHPSDEPPLELLRFGARLALAGAQPVSLPEPRRVGTAALVAHDRGGTAVTAIATQGGWHVQRWRSAGPSSSAGPTGRTNIRSPAPVVGLTRTESGWMLRTVNGDVALLAEPSLTPWTAPRRFVARFGVAGSVVWALVVLGAAALLYRLWRLSRAAPKGRGPSRGRRTERDPTGAQRRLALLAGLTLLGMVPLALAALTR